jgi:hypothetical protein
MSYNPGTLPSAETIVERLSWLNQTRASRVLTPLDIAIKARIIMKESKNSDEALRQLNALLDTHGVEHRPQHPRSDDEGMSFRYLNVGDVYTPTIIRFHGRWYVASYADLIESLEKRGIKFD